MEVIIRIAAGILVGLVLLAAGCSSLLSGATSDAAGIDPEAPTHEPVGEVLRFCGTSPAGSRGCAG